MFQSASVLYFYDKEQSQSTSNFVVWHRKQGPMLKTPLEHFSDRPFDVSLVLVGKFLDQREFTIRQVQGLGGFMVHKRPHNGQEGG